MDHSKSSLERAFEIAKSGKCRTVTEVRNRLLAEGYDQLQLKGPLLTKQIADLIKEARTHCSIEASAWGA